MTGGTADLSGKTCLITGATSGIGEATAHALTAMGADLFLLCRNQAKAERCKADIVKKIGQNRVTLLIGDLASQAEIRRVAQAFLRYDKPLHLLVNNAAVINAKRRLTVDGHEEMFGVNHLAYFLLTHLLLDRLKDSAPARIVNVASEGHVFANHIQFEDLTYQKNFRMMKVYGHSKLANILFTRELARRLEGSGVTANAVHPGGVATGIGSQNGLLGKIAKLIMRLMLQSPEEGAATSVYLSNSPEVEGVTGCYFANCREKQPRPWAMDDDAAKRLWSVSEELTGLSSV